MTMEQIIQLDRLSSEPDLSFQQSLKLRLIQCMHNVMCVVKLEKWIIPTIQMLSTEHCYPVPQPHILSPVPLCFVITNL